MAGTSWHVHHRSCHVVLGKRSLMMIKSTLRRSIRRAQVQDLIGKNVVELVDLPTGQPGRPSRAMTEEQAGKVLGLSLWTRQEFEKCCVA